MSSKITRDVVESFLHCKLKGHLVLTGQQGIKSDYEIMIAEKRADGRLDAIDKILTDHPGEEIPRNIPLTTSILKQGASFILDPTLEDDFVCLDFDALKKVDGPSKLGTFHYAPVLFSQGSTVGTVQRSLLELYGLLLSRLQGQMPVNGFIWHGNTCKAVKVRLNADLRNTERLLRDLKDICSSAAVPPLILKREAGHPRFGHRTEQK